jgi:hypothetical protein
MTFAIDERQATTNASRSAGPGPGAAWASTPDRNTPTGSFRPRTRRGRPMTSRRSFGPPDSSAANPW